MDELINTEFLQLGLQAELKKAQYLMCSFRLATPNNIQKGDQCDDRDRSAVWSNQSQPGRSSSCNQVLDTLSVELYSVTKSCFVWSDHNGQYSPFIKESNKKN